MKDNELILEQISASDDIISKHHIFLAFKRFFDIIVSLIGIVPLILLVIVVKIVYMCSGDFKTIFYKHTRIGKNGKKFGLYKFRTMVTNSAEILENLLKNPKYAKEWKENHKFENDPRITKMGKILRKTSLDEIPQILNILKGEMSIIGPRPLIDEEVEEYGENKEKLLSVRPGLTGWWACNGRSDTTNEERMKLELYYIDHMGIKLDIKIFFKTIIKVIKKEGAK